MKSQKIHSHKKSAEPTRNAHAIALKIDKFLPESHQAALIQSPAAQALSSDTEISNLKLINKKMLFDSNIKCELIKQLTKKNFELKNEIINLNEEIRKLQMKLKFAISGTFSQPTQISTQQASIDNISFMTSSLNSFYRHSKDPLVFTKVNRAPTVHFKQNDERLKNFNFQENQNTKTQNKQNPNNNTCISEEVNNEKDKSVPKITRRNLRTQTHAAIRLMIPESSKTPRAFNNALGRAIVIENTHRILPTEGSFIPSPVYTPNNNGIRHYDNFKLNSNFEFSKGDSFLTTVNGQIPLTKYTLDYSIAAVQELQKTKLLMSSYSTFISIFTDPENSKKEQLYYNIKCIINDFKNLIENLTVTNNLLKAQQKFNERRSIDELFDVVEKVCSKIINCSRAVLFLYDKKSDEYFTIIKRSSEKREIRLSGKEGFVKNLRVQEKPIVVDQAFSQFEFTSGFKLIDKELEVKTISLMIYPVYAYKSDTAESSNLEKTKKVISLSGKYNKSFYRKHAGFLMLINKKEVKPHTSNPNSSNIFSPSKSRFSLEETQAANPSFNIDDEAIANVLSKQISTLLDIVYSYQRFSNKEYKLNKTLELIQRVSIENKKSFLGQLISTMKKLFLTDKVQVVICEKDNFLRITDEKDIEVAKLEGLINHAFQTKQPTFTNDAKNNMMYNPMFDIDGCDTIYTAPILRQTDLNNDLTQIRGIIQFEYLSNQVPWENDVIYHSLTSFDNDLIDVLLPAISNSL